MILEPDVAAARRPRRTIRRRSERRLAWARAWPLGLATAALLPMFALGLQGIVWALPGAVLGWRILTRPGTYTPRSTMAMILLVGWAAASVIQIEPGGAPLFVYRWLLFVGAVAAQIWIENEPEETVSTERLVRWIAMVWVSLVVCGWIARVMPALDMPSPIMRVVPPMKSNAFISDISSWRIAEVQNLAGDIVGRPSAPFPAANGWGAAFAITTPFFVRAWLVDVTPRRRLMGLLLMAAAVPPVITAANRFVFVSIGFALIYLGFRRALQGDLRPLLVVIGVFVIATVLIFTTPLGEPLFSRLEVAEKSNESRGSVYEEAWNGALESPLIGHGEPTKIEGSSLPPIGTHGLVWFVMYVYGFPALVLLILWIGAEVVKSAPARAPGSMWTHLSLVIAFISTPIYGMLPQIVIVGMAAGIANRERVGWERRRAAHLRSRLDRRRADFAVGRPPS